MTQKLSAFSAEFSFRLAGVPSPPAHIAQVICASTRALCRVQASPPASLRSRVLVAAASTVAVVAAIAVSATMVIPTAARFLAGRIAALLRCGAAFNPAHLLWTGLALDPLDVARRVIPEDLPFRPSLHRAAFNPAHFLRTGLPLAAVEGALPVVVVHGLTVHPLDGRTVLAPLPIGLCGTLRVK